MSLVNLKNQNDPMRTKASGAGRSADLYNLDILDMVRRKFPLILFFLLLGIGLSVMYYLKAPKTFESTAKIFVDEKNAPTMNSDNSAFATDENVEKYLEILKSTKILQPAIDRGNFYNMNLFAECDDVLFKLREGEDFQVMPADTKSNSGVIRLSFSGDTPEECKKVLEDIIDSFDRHIKSTTRNIGGENANFVQRAETKWLSRLKDVEKEIESLMVRPELLNVEGKVVNPYQMDLSLLRNDLHKLRSQRGQALARLQKVREDQALGRSSDDLISEIMFDESNVSDNSYARVNGQLLNLRVEEQDLLNEYGDDHPELKSIRRKISTVELMLQRELGDMRGGRGQATATPDLVADFIQKTERQVSLLVAGEKQIEDQVANIQQKSMGVSSLVEKLNALQRERERLETGYYALIEQMSEVNALKEHLWRNLSILDPPSAAEEVAPKLSICLAAGLMLGSLMGLAFAAFKDMAEKTFRSSDDVGAMLDTRVIGHVSLFQKVRSDKRNSKFPEVQPEIVTIHRPAVQASESYRAIRTSLFFQAQEKGAKIIQVTSPAPGDGKSTTCANLAASIAQSGRRVLLLDADMRKPTQHKMFGVSKDLGLSSVITGEATAMEVVQEVIPDYLSVISAGPIPANPAELLTSARFASILNEYRDAFDYVIIDTPPMLAVTDPSIICSHSDLVYMVMRIRNGVRTNSLRSKEIIDSMGIELGGVIINGLRRRDQKNYEYSGQYGYGTYSYGKTAEVNNKAVRRVRPRGNRADQRVSSDS